MGDVTCDDCQRVMDQSDMCRHVDTCDRDPAAGLRDRAEQAERERAIWEQTCAELRVFESRISGVLCDANVPMADMVEAVRQVVRERDEARAALESLRTLRSIDAGTLDRAMARVAELEAELREARDDRDAYHRPLLLEMPKLRAVRDAAEAYVDAALDGWEEGNVRAFEALRAALAALGKDGAR